MTSWKLTFIKFYVNVFLTSTYLTKIHTFTGSKNCVLMILNVIFNFKNQARAIELCMHGGYIGTIETIKLLGSFPLKD